MFGFFAKQGKRVSGPRPRKLRVERMEAREVLASNFTATLAAGALTLVGSNDNDSLSITQIGSGLLVSASGPINGGSSVRFFNGVTNLSIATGGGIDGVSLGTVNLAGNLTINTDFNALLTPGVPNNTALQDRADGVSIGNVRVGGNLTVNTGGGNDGVSLGRVSIGGTATINEGAGNDALSMGQVAVTGATTIDTNSGNDTVVIASSVFTGPVTINLGDGDDTLVIANSRFNSTVTVNGGSGVNRKTIINNVFTVAPVYTTI